MADNCATSRPVIHKFPPKRICLDASVDYINQQKTEPNSDICSQNEELEDAENPKCDEFNNTKSSECDQFGETTTLNCDQWDDSSNVDSQFESSSTLDTNDHCEPNSNAPHGRNFLKSWKKTFPYLEHDKIKNIMFCKICRQFANSAQQNMHFVVGTNNFRFSTLILHDNSLLHLRCKKLAEATQNGDPLELLDNDQRKIVQLLKLVYFMIRNRIPFSEFPKLCKNRNESCLDIGPAYTSHKTIVPFFARYIAQQLENDLSQKLAGCKLFSLIMDNSMTRGTENQHLVYVKYLQEDELKIDFLGVIDSSGSSGSVFDNLNKLFQRYNLMNWLNNVAHVFIDTWSSSPSWYFDFIEMLKENSSNSFIADVNFLHHKITRCGRLFCGNFLTQHFKWLVYDIFWYYKNLPEDKKELSHIDKEVEAMVLKYGNLHKKISSSFCFDEFEAVNKDWVSLIHLLRRFNKSNLDVSSQNIGFKILQAIRKSKFLWKLALVLDIFKCLTELANKIADPDCMTYALPLELKETCYKIKEAVSGRGEYVEQFQRDLCTTSSKFRNIPIDNNASLIEIVRMMQIPANSLLHQINQTADSLSWLEDCLILDTRIWPKGDSLSLYGNSEFSNLYLKLSGTEDTLQEAVSEWCTLKKNVSLCFPLDVLNTPFIAISNSINVFHSELPLATTLLEKLLLLNFSSVELERGYCETNLIKSCERSRLSVSSLHSSLIIAIHGPPIEHFNFIPVMEAWMRGCVRRFHKRKGGNIPASNSCCERFMDSINICDS